MLSCGVSIQSCRPRLSSNLGPGHNYGIVVNKHSKRFYDEGNRHLFATFEMIALECWKDQDMSCFFITDDAIMERFKGSWVYETTEVPPEKADTIEELAQKLGLDPEATKKTVEEYNAAINDKTFDLMKVTKQWAKTRLVYDIR